MAVLSLPKIWAVAAAAVTLSLVALPPCQSSAFAPPAIRGQLRRAPMFRFSASSSSIAASTSSSSPAHDGPAKQIDANGNEILTGSAVRISIPNLKAHSVPKTAFGKFDLETKEFVPQDAENIARGVSCLQLPVGLQGTVSKVYDTNEYDRTQPILVKFLASAPGGEGYTAPKTFMMHFESDEIECVM